MADKGKTALEPKFLMADTPGYPDCNPALFAAPDGTLWLFWPTILDHRWEGALLKYAPPRPAAGESHRLEMGGVRCLARHAQRFCRRVRPGDRRTMRPEEKYKYSRMLDELKKLAGDELYQRLGWMPRVHPLCYLRAAGSCPFIPTRSPRRSWRFPMIGVRPGRPVEPLIGFGNIQPSLVRKNDGELVAFMRDNGPHHRIRLCGSATTAFRGRRWSIRRFPTRARASRRSGWRVATGP